MLVDACVPTRKGVAWQVHCADASDTRFLYLLAKDGWNRIEPMTRLKKSF